MDYQDLASANPRNDCPLAEAHVFAQVCGAIGLSSARIFAEPQPTENAAVLLIPETANKKDGTDPDLQTGFVDTSGTDFSGLTGDPGTAIFAMVKVAESGDFFTVAPTMKRLRSGVIPTELVLQSFIHEVSEGGRISWDTKISTDQVSAVKALLSS